MKTVMVSKRSVRVDLMDDSPAITAQACSIVSLFSLSMHFGAQVFTSLGLLLCIRKRDGSRLFLHGEPRSIL